MLQHQSAEPQYPHRPSVARTAFAIFAVICSVVPVAAEIRHDPSTATWVLASGSVEYRLRRQDGVISWEYFGPAGGAAWRELPQPAGPRLPEERRFDMGGMVEGQPLTPANLTFQAHEVRALRPGVDELRLVYQHRRLPLEIETRYTAWGDTGVFTRQTTLTNRGDRTLRVGSLPSLAWQLPPGEHELTYLWGAWGRERQLASERLPAGRREFVSTRGRSTSGYVPWFVLHHPALGTRYAAQLAYSGNWQMSFEKYPEARPLRDVDLRVELGMRFDFGGALALEAGASFAAPAVAFTAAGGDLDQVANQLHRYQRRYVIPRTPTNDPLLVQFNSWYPFPGKPTLAEMQRCADIAAELGAEVFVLDAGWFNKKDWSREIGDWQVDRVAFPNGLEELAGYVRRKGMKFGIWVEIENFGVDSQNFRQHPDWVLAYNGEPLKVDERYHLNFAQPEVRAWARAVMDRLVRDYQIEWVKIDYNIDIGERFDPAGSERTGAVLHRHLLSYYGWLDELRAAYPNLVIENCSSGGLRFDLGIMARTHTTWISDEVRPVPSVQLGYGCTVEWMPEVCNHWMVGETFRGEADLKRPLGWWDFMFRVPMNGQFGISSRVYDWTPEIKARAAENIRLYKRLRQVIMGADVYHLTPAPANDDPTGWSAIQYVSPDRKRSVLMAYRLGKSNARELFRLRGLENDQQYRLTEDGRARGTFSGRKLSADGLPIELDAEWRAAVIELEATR